MTVTTRPVPADALVLFGVSGDLAHRKLLRALYHITARGQLNLPVIGIAASDWDDQQLALHAAGRSHRRAPRLRARRPGRAHRAAVDDLPTGNLRRTNEH